MKTRNYLQILCLIFIAATLIFKPIQAQEVQPTFDNTTKIGITESGDSKKKSEAVSIDNNAASIQNNNLTPPPNDAFADARTIFITLADNGTNVESTGEAGEPNPGSDSSRNTVWYKWTAPYYVNAEIVTGGSNFDTTLAVFTGNSLSDLTLVGYNDDIGGGVTASRVRFRAEVGVTYYFVVDGFGANTGNIALELRPAPANETFANFTNLGTLPSGRVYGSNFDAAVNESGEPATAFRTVWHRWTAPASGSVTFETCNSGSTFDTKIDVYTGTIINLLNLVATNDDGCPGSFNSRVTFNAISGVTYIIRVGNFANAQGGTFFLDWGKPVEDDFNVLDGVYNFGNNILATGQSGEPNHAGQSGQLNSVWYKFTVNENTFAQIDTRGSFFDTTLAVYTGNSLGALTLVAENDDEQGGGSTFTSRVTFLAVPGRTYHIAVDGFGGSVGYFYLNYGFFTTAPFDFDGDAKTDVSIFRPSGGEWWYLRSSDNGNRAFQFGTATDKLVPADYTGDGKTDVAFWRPSTGQWFVLRSEDSSFYAFPFGANGDIPAPADYDGDGKTDAAVFRPSNTTWFISKSSGGTDIVSFGTSTDKPVIDDYDGDGKADIAIYRNNGGNSEWWIRQSSNGNVFATQFGLSSDKAVQGDYTGDGKADIAIWRPSNGNWFVLRSEDLSFYSFPFGANGDTPVPGDYDGDGRIDASVFRSASSTWFLNRSVSGVQILNFGIAGDNPVPNIFVP